MRIRLDPNSGVPLGLQIARQIRLGIASRRFAPGDRLPSARGLAATLSVNFHTVRRAYADLETQGLLRCERGRGTFVAMGARKISARQIRRIIRAHMERVAEDVAGLDLAPDVMVQIAQDELARILGAERAKGWKAAETSSGPKA